MDQWIFFAATIFVAPALLLAITGRACLYERYFYVNVLFLLLLQAYFLSRVVRGSRLGTAAAILYLTFFALANARPTYEFLKIGRGHFRDALAYMVVHSSSPEIQLAGSAEFCYRLYSAFYLRTLPAGHHITFHDISAVDVPAGAEWIMMTSQEQPYNPPRAVRTRSGV